MDNSNVNIDLIRGHVDTIILKALCYEDRYGYEILNEIKEKSNGLYTLKQPTLYSCLKRLEKQGYIRSYKGDTSNGAQRVYYSLQPAGRAFLESDQHQWEFSRTIINNLLSDREFDPEKHVAPFDPSSFRPLTKRQRIVDGDYESTAVYPVQENNGYYNDQSAELHVDIIDEENKSISNVESENNNYNVINTYSFTNNEPVYNIDDNKFSSDEEIASENFQNNKAVLSHQNNNFVCSSEHSDNNDNIDNNKSRNENANSFQSVYNKMKNDNKLPDYSVKKQDFDLERSVISNTSPQQSYVNDDFSRSTVNYIDSFDSIYNFENTNISTKDNEADANEFNDVDSVAFLSTEKLKAKMMSEGYNLKPYVKRDTSEYYINQYYFSNRLKRDCSLITYIVFAVGVLIAYFSTASKYNTSIGIAIAFMGVGLLYPLAMTVNALIDPSKRSKATFNAKNALINSLIVIINAIIIIVLIGFLGCGAKLGDVATAVVPIIIPIVFLLIIPIAIAVYYVLYKSGRYHVN